MTNENPHPLNDLEQVFTPDEAAAYMKLNPRAVITAGKRHGLCFVRGRDVRFTATQLKELIEALRFKPISGIQEGYYQRWQSAKASVRLRERVEKESKERQARKAANAAARREASIVRQREKAEARRVKKAEKIAARQSKMKQPPSAPLPEPLERKNRDPSYWTEERKLQLRQERVDRMKAWSEASFDAE